MEDRTEGKVAGILWIILWYQLALSIAFIFLGAGPRLFAEQPAWLLGMGLSGQRDPDGHVFTIHLAATFILGLTMWMWWQGHPWLRRGIIATIVAQILIAPFGLALAGILTWFVRRKDRVAEIEAQQGLSGRAMGEVIATWSVASTLMFIASVPTFVVTNMQPILWPGALLLCGTPQVAAFLWLKRRAQKSDTHIAAPMPELPDAPWQDAGNP